MKMNYEIKLTDKMLSLLVSSRMNVSLLKAKPELIKRKVIFSSFPKIIYYRLHQKMC